jgi:hypothetical protein
VLVNQFGDPGVGTKSTRTARYVATARKALSQLGVRDAKQHIMVTLTTTPSGIFPPLTTTYVSRTPFTSTQVAAMQNAVHRVPHTSVLYSPAGDNDLSAFNTLINGSNSSVSSYRNAYPYSVGATSDDKPFFFHFSSFGTQLHNFTHPIQGNSFESGVGERVLMLLLAFAVILSAIFLLLPFVAIRKTWKALPRKGRSALYFCAIGFGFMLFEVTLIQKLVLFLGYPTYSLTVTLCSLLIFVGLGSLLSSRFQPRGPTTPVVLAIIAGITAYYLWGLGPTTNALLDLAIGFRVVIAFLLVAPLGLSLGLFMPLGVRAVAGLSPHEQEYVAWAWALNGFASVVASVLGTMLAMTYGFHTVLVVALIAYCIAVLTLRTLSGTKAPLPAG